MADYFVSASGSNTSPYDTWAKAATSFQTALTAATAVGDRVIIDCVNVPSTDQRTTAVANVTYTGASANPIVVIASTNSGTNTITPTVMADTVWVGASAGNFSTTLNFSGRVYGVHFRMSAGTFALSNTCQFESCKFSYNVLNASASGLSGTYLSRFVNNTFMAASSAAVITSSQNNDYLNCVWTGTAPTTLFQSVSIVRDNTRLEACDLSLITGTLVAEGSVSGMRTVVFENCKLGSGVTPYSATRTVNWGTSPVILNNCSSTDENWRYQFQTAAGTITSDTSIYANDGAAYDGTNRYSWKIVTPTATSLAVRPFITPWIECYNSGTTAISPYIEIARSGSSTAYTNGQVWAEFSYQGTSGFPESVLVDTRVGLTATATDIPAGMGTGSWTGLGGTAWSGKIAVPSAITPAEIGSLKVRLYIAVSNTTLYVDPQIRGRS